MRMPSKPAGSAGRDRSQGREVSMSRISSTFPAAEMAVRALWEALISCWAEENSCRPA